MDPNYRASEGQWTRVEGMGIRHRCATSECLVELRARVEALEAAQQPAPATEESSATAAPAPDDRLRWCPSHGQQPRNAWGCPECVRELRAAAAPPAPADGLVERVHSCIVGEPECGHMQARAAIREVAAWLRSEPWIGRAAADRLEREANR
jgi:hypothetical protein